MVAATLFDTVLKKSETQPETTLLSRGTKKSPLHHYSTLQALDIITSIYSGLYSVNLLFSSFMLSEVFLLFPLWALSLCSQSLLQSVMSWAFIGKDCFWIDNGLPLLVLVNKALSCALLQLLVHSPVNDEVLYAFVLLLSGDERSHSIAPPDQR